MGGVGWGGGRSPHSSPWVVPGSLCQQVVHAAVGYGRPGCQRREELIILLRVCIVSYNFKSTCLWLNWSCFNSPVYGKDPKKLLLEVKWFWCKNEVSCVRMSLFVVADKHSVALLLRSPAWGLTHRPRGRTAMASGHSDYTYCEFVRNIWVSVWARRRSADLKTSLKTSGAQAPPSVKVTLTGSVNMQQHERRWPCPSNWCHHPLATCPSNEGLLLFTLAAGHQLSVG